MSEIKRKRISIIWKMPTAELQELINNSSSFTEVLKYFGFGNKGNNFRTLHARIKEDNLDISLLEVKRSENVTKRLHAGNLIQLSVILTENSSFNRGHLKKRLLKEGLLENKCAICGQLPEWNGKPLTLELDHINGLSNDNRLENLRIICPHCHSQTDNYAGKNKKYVLNGELIEPKIPEPLPSELDPNWRHAPRPDSRKVERPSKEELEKLLWEKPTTEIAKNFDVSDSAIVKWAKAYGITKPPRGYWQKLKAA